MISRTESQPHGVPNKSIFGKFLDLIDRSKLRVTRDEHGFTVHAEGFASILVVWSGTLLSWLLIYAYWVFF